MFRWYGLLFLAFALSGCAKDDDAALTTGEWKVVRIQPAGERSQRASEEYLLLLRIDGVYSLNLDVNACGGPYFTDGAGGIDFLGVSCTRICCDSAFAQQLALILDGVSNYRVERNKLLLTGVRGIIEAKRSRD